MKNLLPVRLFLAVLLITVVSPVGSASASYTNDDYEADVVKQTNIERLLVGAHTVKTGSCVDYYAERQARWMAYHRSLQHQDLSRILSNCNLSSVGENVAYGYTSGISLVLAWMLSPLHAYNILRWRYRLIGVGVYKDAYGTRWVSQVFGSYT